jgi:glycosyltransferase involved in cell wall biosynthesis
MPEQSSVFASVIIPVHQPDPALFDNCLQSLTRQGIPRNDFEVIVVFDGVPDNRLSELVERWQGELNIKDDVIPESGVSAARNVGIEISNSDWITFLDCDDMLADDALRKFLSYGIDNDCDVLIGGYITLLEDSREEHWYANSDIPCSTHFAKSLRHDVLHPTKSMSSVWGKLYRSSFIRTTGVRFNEELQVAEDTDFVFRLLQQTNQTSFLHETMYIYRRNSSSTVLAFRNDYVIRIVRSLDDMRETIDALPDSASYSADYNEYVLFHLLLILVHYLFNARAPWNDHDRRVEYQRVLDIPVFRSALQANVGRDMPLTRRIALFSMRHGLYEMSRGICLVRQRQLGVR